MFNSESYVGLVFPNSTTDGAYRLQVYSDKGDSVLTTYFDMECSEIIFNNKQIIIYNEDECLIMDMNGHVKYHDKFEVPVRTMVPTSVRSKFTLVTGNSVVTMNLK